MSRDTVKSSIVSTTRPPADELRRGGPVAAHTFTAFEAVVGTYLANGVSVIAEQTLERGRSEGFLRQFEEAATILLIYCQVTRQTSIERFAARVGSPSRRNVTDGEILRGLRSGAIDHARFEPLDAPYRALLLDCENPATEAWERTYARATAVIDDALGSAT